MKLSHVEGGCVEGTVLVRVHGLGSLRVATALNEFIKARLQERCTRFVVDLSPCDGMDSTFMGVLAGAALSLPREEGRSISIVNFNERCYRQMEELGLTRVLDVKSEPIRLPSIPLETIAREEDSPFPLPTVRSSHENLVKADPKNLEKFGPFLKDLQGGKQ